VVPQFLSMSFEMLRDGQSKLMENMTKANPMSSMPGFEAMQAQQKAFMKAMTGGLSGGWPGGSAPAKEEDGKEEDLDDIKKQLAELQDKLSKL
jgi:polyhydroxyalkanoate synthesis regulator protein